MTGSIRSTLRLITAFLAIAALTGCQVEVDGSKFGSAAATQSPKESSEVQSNVTGSVSLYWSAPIQRINGEDISFEELGGYEIRYSKDAGESYTRIVIDDPLIEQYHIDDLQGDDYQFEVAVFDASGLYSDFVTAVR